MPGSANLRTTRLPLSTCFVTAAAVLFFLPGCKNAADIPFPAGEGLFPSPISQPIKISPEIKLHWQESALPVRSTVRKFDLNKLPLIRWDSSELKPFLKKPTPQPLDIDRLPKTGFDYRTLKASPLKY